jgi:hypothetical protein
MHAEIAWTDYQLLSIANPHFPADEYHLPWNLTTVTSKHKDIRHNPLMILIHSTVRLNTRQQTVNPTCVSFLSDFLLQHHAKLKTLSIKQHMHNWTEFPAVNSYPESQMKTDLHLASWPHQTPSMTLPTKDMGNIGNLRTTTIIHHKLHKTSPESWTATSTTTYFQLFWPCRVWCSHQHSPHLMYGTPYLSWPCNLLPLLWKVPNLVLTPCILWT